MKIKIITLLVFGLIFFSTQVIANDEQNIYKLYQNKEQELNSIYHKLLIIYKEDKIFIKKLSHSQEIWKLYRNSLIDMYFPHDHPYPIRSQCLAAKEIDIINDRIAILNKIISNDNEYELCSK